MDTENVKEKLIKTVEDAKTTFQRYEEKCNAKEVTRPYTIIIVNNMVILILLIICHCIKASNFRESWQTMF